MIIKTLIYMIYYIKLIVNFKKCYLQTGNNTLF